MSYYDTWMERSETITDQNAYTRYINLYYSLEKNAYDKILSSYPENSEFTSGAAADLAGRLGFDKNTMDIFVGFLDGIQTSLKNEIDVKSVDDETDINLDIDYEKLYYNMKDAKATWLFKLPSWKNVLPTEKIDEINHDYKEANTAHAEIIGRNDPCPCGSGKKYKKCCGRNL